MMYRVSELLGVAAVATGVWLEFSLGWALIGSGGYLVLASGLLDGRKDAK